MVNNGYIPMTYVLFPSFFDHWLPKLEDFVWNMMKHDRWESFTGDVLILFDFGMRFSHIHI